MIQKFKMSRFGEMLFHLKVKMNKAFLGNSMHQIFSCFPENVNMYMTCQTRPAGKMETVIRQPVRKILLP